MLQPDKADNVKTETDAKVSVESLKDMEDPFIIFVDFLIIIDAIIMDIGLKVHFFLTYGTSLSSFTFLIKSTHG